MRLPEVLLNGVSKILSNSSIRRKIVNRTAALLPWAALDSNVRLVLQVNDMEVTSDFARLKVSVLEKASRISAITKMDRITIGPQSAQHEENSGKVDNIENEQNSCNIKSPQRSVTSPKHNMVFTPNGICFSLKKILLESELQRKEEVRVSYLLSSHIYNKYIN